MLVGRHLVAAIVGGAALLACSDDDRPAASNPAPIPASTTTPGGDAGVSEGGAPLASPEPLAVAAGNGYTCALAKQGKSAGLVFCWGANDAKQLGADGTGFVRPALPPDALPILAVGAHAAGKTTCAIDAVSHAWCWGANDRGQSGAPATATAPPTRLKVDGATINTNALFVGARHACMTRDGSDGASIACWGDNAKCELGVTDNGACTPDLLTDAVVGNELGTAKNPVLVAPGLDFTCALGGEDSKVRCWGDSSLSQCGTATGTPVIAPFEIGTATHLASGSSFACAVFDGAAKCWGSNAGHAISDGDEASASAPVDSFPGVNAVSVAAGASAACAVDATGHVHCRGSIPGAKGTAAAPVSGVEAVTSIAIGNGHVCVIGKTPGAESAGLICWGANDAGQIDPTRASPQPITTPTTVKLPATP